jgi:hypothetical protein
VETISILDANTSSVLSTRTFSGFHADVYAIWNIGGHVLIQVANRGGLNAVISGVFFGATSTLPPPTASAVFVPPPGACADSGDVHGRFERSRERALLRHAFQHWAAAAHGFHQRRIKPSPATSPLSRTPALPEEPSPPSNSCSVEIRSARF